MNNVVRNYSQIGSSFVLEVDPHYGCAHAQLGTLGYPDSSDFRGKKTKK